MSIFSWLILGHLIGDWLLQNDWMANGKNKAIFTRAGLVHYAIYTLTIMVTLVIIGASEKNGLVVAGLGLLTFVSHWVIDATGLVNWWMRFYRQTNISVVRLMVDQILHLLILAGIALVWSYV